MSFLFLIQKCTTGKESEPFLYRLRPILGQIIALKNLKNVSVPTLVSVLTGKTSLVASTSSKVNTDFNTFSIQMKRKILQDQTIQQKKLHK